MSDFLGDAFLLRSHIGRALYHDHAAGLPVVDYHCHIDPQAVATDQVFEDIAQLWVASDPYKWRAMRMNGIAESRITGGASNLDKFKAWSETLPYTVGNPLFHWSALELKRTFCIDQSLCPQSADAIWASCNERLSTPGFTARGLLAQAKVETLCTSDDLLDSLDFHRRMRDEGCELRMLPSLRADRVLALQSEAFPAFCSNLAAQTGVDIVDLDAFMVAVRLRLDVFDALGCRVADLGLDEPFFDYVEDGQAAALFARLLAGHVLDAAPLLQLKSNLLVAMGVEYHRRGWMMQLHIGAKRDTSERLRLLTGQAGGYACIGKSSDVATVCSLLDRLERIASLPRTLLFSLNPSDTEMFASLAGSFTEGGVPGKVQFGPAWWLNDHRDGIERQLRAFGNLGLLSRHIGMTTDSRSLLSYSRHEYYRRILCNMLGEWVEAGELPHDQELLARMVRDICYFNARNCLESATATSTRFTIQQEVP